MSTVEARIKNTLQDVPRVHKLLAELAVVHALPSGVVADMGVALDEVLSNIIEYAYADQNVHEISVRLTIGHDAIIAEMEDDGHPFNPLSVPSPDLTKPMAERKIGGLGIHFLRTIMSEVTYSRAEGRNRLVVKRSLAQ